MKLHILGTGNGDALNCYNTCFAIENNKEYLLVDGGGGNQILNQLKLANIDITKIHHVFLSHNHTDHILGVIWVLRNVCKKMKFGGSYMGNLNIYGSDESMKVLKLLIELLFPMVKQFKDRIIFNVVNDNFRLLMILSTCGSNFCLNISFISGYIVRSEYSCFKKFLIFRYFSSENKGASRSFQSPKSTIVFSLVIIVQKWQAKRILSFAKPCLY